MVVWQVPAYLGVCRSRLLHLLAEKIQKREVTSGNRRISLRDAVSILKGPRADISLFTTCKQTVQGRQDWFWAAPESKHFPRRFDFVQECIEDGLWDYPDSTKPCRPIMHLRGFVQVSFSEDANLSDKGVLQLALGRNLIPHDDSLRICDDGNPVHPVLNITHCLWQYQR